MQQYITNHGTTTGQIYINGYLKLQGLHVQRQRIRESMARVDPQNTILQWVITVSHRAYKVPWPNSFVAPGWSPFIDSFETCGARLY